MKNSTLIASLAATGTFFALCWLFSGAADNASWLMSLNPISSFTGLAFALSFAAGFPIGLAIAAACGVFILIPAAVFFISRRWLRRYDL
ncbi:hypothetical protein [Oceanisphaera pacifica]|uniref:Uncharacterized protein n=1 Tax=Oceanisphaera pacifica TaxID=2818389 RepID=A0ABS3ND85_9GAMM|nr:hypothetical protein [Oceanisphaera pacifica]MBO1518251.1 hypothetical protein [Oceanisphaera pacifica]